MAKGGAREGAGRKSLGYELKAKKIPVRFELYVSHFIKLLKSIDKESEMCLYNGAMSGSLIEEAQKRSDETGEEHVIVPTGYMIIKKVKDLPDGTKKTLTLKPKKTPKTTKPIALPIKKAVKKRPKKPVQLEFNKDSEIINPDSEDEIELINQIKNIPATFKRIHILRENANLSFPRFTKAIERLNKKKMIRLEGGDLTKFTDQEKIDSFTNRVGKLKTLLVYTVKDE
jgi:hypothetical protein